MANLWTVEESHGPYAWRYAIESRPTHLKHEANCPTPFDGHHGQLDKSRKSKPPGIESDARLGPLLQRASAIDAIAFNLPVVGAVAGKVLQHSVDVLETLFAKFDPMIFKVGFTHDPCWRWTNKMYGYCHGREKWSKMVVFYVSSEPHGPAMLESALIEKYRGNFLGKYGDDLIPICWFELYNWSYKFKKLSTPKKQHLQHHSYPGWTWGKPGCRNERRGGDTVTTNMDGLYMCYIVYRSFKFKPV